MAQGSFSALYKKTGYMGLAQRAIIPQDVGVGVETPTK
jgi:hypothetical protein